MVFSPDGSRLALLESDNKVGSHNSRDVFSRQVWDVATGRPAVTLENVPDDTIFNDKLSFTPDGQRLAAWGDAEYVFFWDATSGAYLHRLPIGTGVRDTVFSRDGSRLACSDRLGERVGVWNAADGKYLAKLEKQERGEQFSGIALSPDGAQP